MIPMASLDILFSRESIPLGQTRQYCTGRSTRVGDCAKLLFICGHVNFYFPGRSTFVGDCATLLFVCGLDHWITLMVARNKTTFQMWRCCKAYIYIYY